MKTNLFFIIFLFFISLNLNGQLFIDESYTVEEMVTDFFLNNCVTPSNISYIGGDGSIAFFDAGNTNMQVQAGIFIGNGEAVNAIGPNDSNSKSTDFGLEGDEDLESLVDITTYDAAVLTMDLVAQAEELEFSYIFASEEYPEFASSALNDVFAFFISGPGIPGVDNIALIPGTGDYVAISTVNDEVNSEYYVDNFGDEFVQYDGHTIAMTASVEVIPGETYSVKITIADGSDQVYDSGIFLAVESLCGEKLMVPPAKGQASIQDKTVSFTNESKYATSYLWEFGDGTTSNEKNPDPHTYLEDGYYDIKLITFNYCCSDTLIHFVTIGNPSSTNDIEESGMTIAPNPAKDVIDLISDWSGDLNISIFSGSGSLILQKQLTDERSLDIRELPDGMYWIKVNNGDRSHEQKLIKY